MISWSPYYFTRTYQSSDYVDRVVVGLDLDKGSKEVTVEGVFENGEEVTRALFWQKGKSGRWEVEG